MRCVEHRNHLSLGGSEAGMDRFGNRAIRREDGCDQSNRSWLAEWERFEKGGIF